MRVLKAFIAVVALVLVALVVAQVPGGQSLLGIVLPYLAFAIFLGGFIYKVVYWAKSPVPFRIPTTCGQENSLPFIKQNKLDCPTTKGQVVGRMLLEVLLFRSLFRNTRASIHDGPTLAYGSNKWLWLFALLFHYSFLVIILRHMRLFTDPIAGFVPMLEFADGFLEVGATTIYQSSFILLAAVTFLFLRRVVRPYLRYISLPADYFPLLLIFGIGLSGILMRHVFRVDIVSVKELTMGLVTFSPSIEGQIGAIFFVHIFLVCVLLAYFPFSKLMHLGGVFMSPTRNMANNSRMVRHENPWNDPNIKPHSYASYEDEFRQFMVDADLPVEKQPEPATAEPEAEEAAPTEEPKA
ncbi:sulfate reduction electron transfer complex DsrMKJOP subunit DsrM [Desulfurivibrio alkaliphilus]|uniref:Nitrate reductase gamma subunit n=1 Tax=Desulfurivibrio alkaliphilus (strain DSM 19089 / UNIQEM U267 / AHT2) TaxID=589865 RepID=D6Z6X6_DESAT|nr:sulfate reduction electron transfer complex DsrMKJOP subunit DsrM [Desulfurivibrio alkaliphilus]ADH86963.1 Nitrate reductase gamma subunit [Desulfurivibrio alkaliphilus AHT 2]